MDNDYKYDSDDQLLRSFLQQHAAQPTGRASFRRRVMLHLPDTIYHIGLCLELAGGVAAMLLLANIIETIDWSNITHQFINLQANL